MANVVSNKKANPENFLQLSNGGMSVLIDILSLVGTRLANSYWEKECITWITTHDQGVFGLGMVGFDIDDIAWSIDCEEFEQQKSFLLEVIARANSKGDWHLLDYEPPYASEYLSKLEKLIKSYKCQHVKEKQWDDSLFPDIIGETCPKHGVFLHIEGCVLCNN